MSNEGLLGLPQGGVKVERMGTLLGGGVGTLPMLYADATLATSNPGSIGGLRVLRISSLDSTFTFDGLPPGEPGQMLMLVNVGTVSMVLSHLATVGTTVTARGRFYSPNQKGYRLLPGTAVQLMYERDGLNTAATAATTSYWRILGAPSEPFASFASNPTTLGVLGTTGASSWFSWYRISPLTSSDYESGGTQADQVSTHDQHRILTNACNPKSGPIGGQLSPVSGVFSTLSGWKIILKHEDPGRSNTTRYLCPNSRDYVLSAGESVLLVYETTITRWRVVAPPQDITPGAYYQPGYVSRFPGPHQSLARAAF